MRAAMSASICPCFRHTHHRFSVQGRHAIEISEGLFVFRAPNKPKYKPRNVGKKSNQSSLTKRALPNAMNYTNWRLFRWGRVHPSPYGHDGKVSVSPGFAAQWFSYETWLIKGGKRLCIWWIGDFTETTILLHYIQLVCCCGVHLFIATPNVLV